MWSISAINEMRKAFLKDRRGATAIEYTLFAALIGIVLVGSASPIGQVLSDFWTDMNDTYKGFTKSSP